MAGVFGAALALTVPEIAEKLDGQVVFFATPAEEYGEIEFKNQLREQGKIRYGGVKGGLHQINFEVTNEEEAYIDTAKMFALAAYGLLKEKAARSRELVENYKPVFKDSAEYTKFMEQFDSKEVLD